jgi:hypothetical protein
VLTPSSHPSSSLSHRLHLSHHADARLQQRGVRASDVALVVAHGTPVRDGYLLRARDVAAAEAELKRTIARLQRLRGTFVAVAEDTVLSVYRPCRVRRRKLLAEGA